MSFFTSVRLTLAYASKLAFVALVSMLVLPVAAAPRVDVILSSGSTAGCEYDGAQVSSNGDFTFTCKTTTNPETPSAGKLSLVLKGSQSILAGSGTTTVAIRRTGATAGGGTASGTLTAQSGGCTVEPSLAQTFSDGVIGDRDITVKAGSASGTCVVALTSIVSATAQAPTSISITVASETPPPTSGCAAYTGRIQRWDGSQNLIDPFGGTGAVAFEIDTATYPIYADSSAYGVGIVGSSSAFATPTIQTSISPCPGDFSAATKYGKACFAHALPPLAFKVALGRTLTSYESFDTCALPASTKFYVNMRPIKTDGSGTTSCRTASCPVYVNINR